MNKTRGQSVLKILNGGVKSLNCPTPPGSKFPISWGGWRCELGGFNPPNPPVKSNPGCYYQLRQLRVVSRSLSPAAASTLVHAFVVSRLDYCSAIYEGLPTCRVKCLDRVLRTAARLVGRIPRFGRVSGYMRDVLHWLPYPQRIV